jgi:hypothetical protein
VLPLVRWYLLNIVNFNYHFTTLIFISRVSVVLTIPFCSHPQQLIYLLISVPGDLVHEGVASYCVRTVLTNRV